jgi:parallel beta-helix repeat protein
MCGKVLSVAIVACMLACLAFEGEGGGARDSGEVENYKDFMTVLKGSLYTNHTPIRINSNADFNAGHGVTSGNGTKWNPWIIENYDINGTGVGYCIYVGNTSNYFVVRGCNLHHASGNSATYYWNSGLALQGVWNGTIDNNTISTSNGYGFYLASIKYNTITNNIVNTNPYGIYLSSGNDNTLVNNTVTDNAIYGFRLSGALRDEIISCQIERNGQGIRINNVGYHIIKNCEFINNTGYAINIEGGFSSPNGVKIFHNNFIGNNGVSSVYNSSHIQVSDYSNNPVGTIWNDTYPSGGNYWSDYNGIDVMSGPNQNLAGGDGFGDTPYTIVGLVTYRDRAPLITPWQPQSSPPQYYKIPVVVGWNLISIPLTPSNSTLPTVIDDLDGDTAWDRTMWYYPYDITDHWKQYYKNWSSALNQLGAVNVKMGVWVNITTVGDGFINISGSIPISISISLRAGWNLVGYPTLCANQTVANAFWGTGADIVEVFNQSAAYKTKVVGPNYVMKPGEGYWVHVPADSVWTVDW